MILLSQISWLFVWVWGDLLVCLSFGFFQFLRLNLWSLPYGVYAKQGLYHWGTSPVLFWLSFPDRSYLASQALLEIDRFWTYSLPADENRRPKLVNGIGTPKTEPLEMVLLELGILAESSPSCSLSPSVSTWTWRIWIPIRLKLRGGWIPGWSNWLGEPTEVDQFHPD